MGCLTLLSQAGWALGEGRTLVRDHAYGARWSPNGNRLAFVSTTRYRNPSLDVANATGTRLMKLTGKWYVQGAPAWSPRGAKLAFVRLLSVGRPNETSSLWTVDTVTRIKKRLAGSAGRFDPRRRDPTLLRSGRAMAAESPFCVALRGISSTL